MMDEMRQSPKETGAMRAAYKTTFQERGVELLSHWETLLAPFRWVERPIDALEFSMRATMARFLAALAMDFEGGAPPSEPTREQQDVMAAVDFLGGYVQEGNVRIEQMVDPLALLRSACESAVTIKKALSARYPKFDDVLSVVEDMRHFHGGFAGVVPDALLRASDEEAWLRLGQQCDDLIACKQVAYHAVREALERPAGRGELLARIELDIHALLPADQVYFLQALVREDLDGAMHAAAVAFYDRYMDRTRFSHCRGEAEACQAKFV